MKKKMMRGRKHDSEVKDGDKWFSLQLAVCRPPERECCLIWWKNSELCLMKFFFVGIEFLSK